MIYTSYTIYKYGFKRWVRLCVFEGWRFFILAFLDVEGNYFVVLAYRYVSLGSPLDNIYETPWLTST
jgi:solute carrier family 35 protein F1/2